MNRAFGWGRRKAWEAHQLMTTEVNSSSGSVRTFRGLQLKRWGGGAWDRRKMEISMEYTIFDEPRCASSHSAESVLYYLEIVDCIWCGVRKDWIDLDSPGLEPCISSSMALWRRDVILLKLIPRKYKVVSFAKSASWTPVCERGILLVYKQYSRGENMKP
ncbi:hypothetical protein EVAR_84612_1 [Eumeta japonica]|uniref:Uncharacterized protein n=1 Tax=Eumeta variegata TaxID=151549 RepID=A0A4C1UZX3_EUMVA|nr:hypothetical protein EVAR_84612_1 [Eumeta japonica]